MASPAFRAIAAGSGGTATSITISKPTGTADNDILLACIYIESDQAITPPTGWTLLARLDCNVSGKEHNGAYYWKRASGEGANWTWTWTTSVFRNGYVSAYQGAVTSGNPNEATNTAVSTSTTAAVPDVAVTSLTADTLIIWQHTNWDGFPIVSVTGTSPASYTQRGPGGGLDAWDAAKGAAGATGNVSGDYSGGNQSAATALLIALASTAPAAAAQPNALMLRGVGT